MRHLILYSIVVFAGVYAMNDHNDLGADKKSNPISWQLDTVISKQDGKLTLYKSKSSQQKVCVFWPSQYDDYGQQEGPYIFDPDATSKIGYEFWARSSKKHDEN